MTPVANLDPVPLAGTTVKRASLHNAEQIALLDIRLGDMVYVEGFGWIESQGPNHVEYAEDMYENGNKIGIMG